MGNVVRHMARCLAAGLGVLVLIAGPLLALVFLENALAGSWLAHQAYYFPGLGVLLAAVALYLIGLFLGWLVSGWMGQLADRFFHWVPILNQGYQALKKMLGHGPGQGTLFERVVLVPVGASETLEMGLVTRTVTAPDQPDQLEVFIPGFPNPLTGHMILVAAERARPVNLPASEALRALLTFDKVDLAALWRHAAKLKNVALTGDNPMEIVKGITPSKN